MRKRVTMPERQECAFPDANWLNVEDLAEVEITSEAVGHPIEGALLNEGVLLNGPRGGWRAAVPGKQTLRLYFDRPQQLRRIWLDFLEPHAERTQQYMLRWSPDGGRTFQDILRQQWNFSPLGAPRETEDHQLDLVGVTVLELDIIPDVRGGNAVASLVALRLA